MFLRSTKMRVFLPTCSPAVVSPTSDQSERATGRSFRVCNVHSQYATLRQWPAIHECHASRLSSRLSTRLLSVPLCDSTRIVRFIVRDIDIRFTTERKIYEYTHYCRVVNCRLLSNDYSEIVSGRTLLIPLFYKSFAT